MHKAIRLGSVRTGMIFAGMALAIFLAFVLYVDSGIAKQARMGHSPIVNAVTLLPMLLGILQTFPLASVVIDNSSGMDNLRMVLTGVVLTLCYFAAGASIGHIFRSKAFTSKIHAARFYGLFFCGTALLFSLLGYVWFYFYKTS